MKRISTLSIALLLFLNISKAQQNSSAGPHDINTFDKTYQLEDVLETVNLQSDILLIQRLTSDSDYFYVFNDKSSPAIKAYRLADGKYMGGFGTIGQGPGEFHYFNRGSFNATNGQLVTQDRKYVRIYEVNEDKEGLTFNQTKEVRIPADLGIVNQGILLDDDLFAGSIMFTEKDFVTFPLSTDGDPQMDQVEDFGDYPQEYPDIPAKAYHDLYQGGSSFTFDGKTLVRFYSRIPMLRIFSLPGGSYRDIWLKPENAQIKDVRPGSRNMSIENGIEMFWYQSGVKIGSDFIVSKYQETKYKRVEMTERGNLEKVPFTDEFLLVFNMEGELLARLATPEWLERFHVTPDDRLLIFHPEISDKLFTVDLNRFK